MRRRFETFRGTRAEAEARAAAIYEEMGANERGMTLAAYYRRRLLPAKRKTTRANLNGYDKMWRHVPDGWKEAELAEPSHAELQAWIDTMTPGTARASYKYLRATLRSAYADGLLPREPCVARVTYPKGAPSEGGGPSSLAAKVWDESETVAAWLLLRGERLEAYVLVAAATGMRREEAIALGWEDIEFKVSRRGILHEVTAWVSVDKALTEEDGMKGTKNPRSVRRVPVCGYAARRLYELRHERGPLAANLAGGRLGVSGLRRQWWNLWRGRAWCATAGARRYARPPPARSRAGWRTWRPTPFGTPASRSWTSWGSMGGPTGATTATGRATCRARTTSAAMTRSCSRPPRPSRRPTTTPRASP